MNLVQILYFRLEVVNNWRGVWEDFRSGLYQTSLLFSRNIFTMFLTFSNIGRSPRPGCRALLSCQQSK